jgi:ABC-2 type transport system permease protein
MADRSGVVYDLGYKPYEGRQLGRAGAIKAIVKDGLRRSFGIRRKARKKVYPWGLVVLAFLPAIVFVGLAFALSSFAPEAESPFGGHAQYISLVGSVIILFVASAAPNLLIPDREEGVLAVYSSRPMTAWDYTWGRVGALALVSAAFFLLPNLLMYVGFAALDEAGLASALIDNLDDLFKVLGTMVAYVVGYGAPALLIATYAKRVGPAAGIYLATVFISPGFAEMFRALDFAGSRYGTLIAVLQHPEVIRNWVFDESQGSVPMSAVGFEPWVSVLFIAAIGAGTVYLMARRYKREL